MLTVTALGCFILNALCQILSCFSRCNSEIFTLSCTDGNNDYTVKSTSICRMTGFYYFVFIAQHNEFEIKQSQYDQSV